ncbi:MAG: gluconate permease [Planctomycetaceae bacterium]|nr:gluconate permease [Planctomycetaceae bacterium]
MHPYLIVAIGILTVLGLIIFLRINAFIALISAALVVSFLAPGPINEKVSRVAFAFGENAGKIGLVIGFAAVIGEAMMLSGAADRIVQAFLKLMGAERASLALMSSGFVLSVPVFFDTVFYLLVPLARSLYRTTRRNYLLYVCAIAAGGAITHTMVPPTPGPLYMAATLGVPIGLMMLIGLAVAAPAAMTALWVSKWMDLNVSIGTLPQFDDGEDAEAALAARQKEIMRIPLIEALLPVLLPVLLISGDTIVGALIPKPSATEKNLTVVVASQKDAARILKSTQENLPAETELIATLNRSLESVTLTLDEVQAQLDSERAAEPAYVATLRKVKPYSELLGNPSLALLVSMMIAVFTWVRLKAPDTKQFSTAVENALLSGGLVILITAAGGAFGAMLKATNMSDTIRESFQGSQATGFIALALGFGLAAILKVAQGSSTTAMITVSGMMAAMELTQEKLGFNPVYLCTAIGAGSLVGSWMNDSGFWIFARMSGLTEAEALKTWTPLLLILATVSLTVTVILATVMPLNSL